MDEEINLDELLAELDEEKKKTSDSEKKKSTEKLMLYRDDFRSNI